jgi:hypothetical protein
VALTVQFKPWAPWGFLRTSENARGVLTARPSYKVFLAPLGGLGPEPEPEPAPAAATPSSEVRFFKAVQCGSERLRKAGPGLSCSGPGLNRSNCLQPEPAPAAATPSVSARRRLRAEAAVARVAARPDGGCLQFCAAIFRPCRDSKYKRERARRDDRAALV